MDKRLDFFKRDKLAKILDFKIIKASVGYAKCSVELKEKHLNGVGMLHGGTIFSLADFALAVASNFSGEISVSTNASINFMKSTKEKTIYAICRSVNETNKLGFYNVSIKDSKKELSRMEATVYKTKKMNEWMKKLTGFMEYEFEKLKEYNPRAYYLEKEIEITDDFYGYVEKNIKNNRRGEVGFLVQTKEGKYVLITCLGYPDHVFRVPTGGLEYGEDIVSALIREVKEELGIEVKIKTFLGTLKTIMKAPLSSIDFYSYLFIVKEVSGNLLDDATDDEINDIRLVDANEINKYVKELQTISDKRWSSWGKFRALTTGEYANYLNDK